MSDPKRNRRRVAMYPNTPLGPQKRPLGKSFNGFKMLREHFLSKREGMPGG